MSPPAQVEIRAPAKVNLFLEVLGKRPDGFHEVETVMQAVDLCDEISITESDGSVFLECDDPSLPTDGRNLACRAAQLMIDESGLRRGVRITLRKRIPVEAGLGGGSSDAAAVLVALNALWDVGLSHARMEQLGAELGSDVPFFIRGGTAVCRGRGEKVEAVATSNVLHFLLAIPTFGASTKKVYERLNLPLTRNVKNVSVLIGRLEGRQTAARDIGQLLFNRLEEPVCGLYPHLVLLKEQLIAGGCEGALVSGSGSCVYGVAAHREAACRMVMPLMGDGTLTAAFTASSLHQCWAERRMRVSR